MKIVNFLVGAVAFVTLAISANSFYYYTWITKYLKYHRLSSLSILTSEDLLYKFGDNTWAILFVTCFWLVPCIFIIAFKSEATNLFSIEKYKEYIKSFDDYIKSLNKSKRIKIVVTLIISTILILSLLFYFSIKYFEETGDIGKTFIILWIALFVIPNIGKFSWEKFLITYFILCFFWGIFFIVDIANKTFNEEKEKSLRIAHSEKLIFSVNDTIYGSKPNEFLIFHGYRFTVLGERKLDGKKSTNTYRIFLTNEIVSAIFVPGKVDE